MGRPPPLFGQCPKENFFSIEAFPKMTSYELQVHAIIQCYLQIELLQFYFLTPIDGKILGVDVMLLHAYIYIHCRVRNWLRVYLEMHGWAFEQPIRPSLAYFMFNVMEYDEMLWYNVKCHPRILKGISHIVLFKEVSAFTR